MSHRFGRSWLIGPLVVASAVIGPVAAAHASDASLLATVKSDTSAITRSQAKILDGEATYQKTHSTTSLIKAVRAQDTNLRRLQTKLRGEASSTSKGARGKADIVRGLGLIISSNKTLVVDIEKQASGKPVSKAQLEALVKSDRKGNADLVAGAKLL